MIDWYNTIFASFVWSYWVLRLYLASRLKICQWRSRSVWDFRWISLVLKSAFSTFKIRFQLKDWCNRIFITSIIFFAWLYTIRSWVNLLFSYRYVTKRKKDEIRSSSQIKRILPRRLSTTIYDCNRSDNNSFHKYLISSNRLTPMLYDPFSFGHLLGSFSIIEWMIVSGR